eukprot:jgi/Tetstr1/431579/TSEL_021110.t1
MQGSRVKELDISNNKRLTWQAAKPLASLLSDSQAHTQLHTLTMVGVDLGNKGVEILGPAVAKSHELKSLDMRRCSIGDIGAVKLSSMLHENTDLETLRLAWNNIRAKGGKALAEMLRQHPTLVGLDLSHNALGDVGGSYIAHSLVLHRTVEWVDLSCNHLQVGSCMALSEVVRGRMDCLRQGGGGKGASASDEKAPVPLRTLTIDGNEIGFLGGYWLLRGLASAMSQSDSGNADSGGGSGDAFSTCTITMNKCSLFKSNKLDRGPGKSLADTRMTMAGAAELDMPVEVKKKPKGKAGGGKKDKAAGLKAPRLYAKDARKLYQTKEMKEWVCSDAEHFNPLFPQISYDLDMDVPSNFQVWKELYRFSMEREELSLKNVKLNGKKVKEEDYAHYAGLTSTGITGRMTLNAVAPLVIPEEDTVVAPQVVVDFCLNHMKEPGTMDGAETPWMLALVRLLTSMFWFSSAQAYQLLQKFPKGTSESCSAALLLFGRCVDPLNFDPVAHALDEDNLQLFWSKAGLLYHIDPRNLTGRYYLKLEHPFEYIMALRLRDASIREGEYDKHPFLVNWRNVTLNGRPLAFAAPMALDSLILPKTGILHLDYISQAQEPEEEPATDLVFGRLFSELQRVYNKYNKDFYRAVVDGARQPTLKKAPSRYVKAPLEPTPPPAEEKKEDPALTPFKKPGRLKLAFNSALKEDSKSHMASMLTRSQTKAYGGLTQAWWHKIPNVQLMPLLQALLPVQRAKYPIPSHRDEPPNSARTPRGDFTQKRLPMNTVPVPARDTLEGMPLAGELRTDSQSGLPPGSSKAKALKAAAAAVADDTVASAEFADSERLVAFYVMSCPTEQDLKILLVSMSNVRRKRVMQLLARLPGGVEVCAAILEAMPSSLATRHMVELLDYPELLLPKELHEQVMKAMHPEALGEVDQISRGIEACCSKRLERVRRAVLRWSHKHCLTCAQLSKLLEKLTYQRDRLNALTALWTSVTDRSEFVPTVVAKLSAEEQVMVYQRLGYYKLMTLTPRPYGIHFRLQLKTQEGRETAMRLCYLATSIYKARQKAAESGKKLTNLLLNFYGDGRNLILTEDDKLWGMVEKYQILEFDVDAAPANTKDANLKKAITAVSFIQRKWRATLATRRWRIAFTAIKISRHLSPRVDGKEEAPAAEFTFTAQSRKKLWTYLHEAVMPAAIEQQISDLENLEAVAHIKHALGKK